MKSQNFGMEGWKSVLKADPTDWLLEEDNPSVRYFTLKDLMGLPDNHSDVLAAKRAIPTSKVVMKIFSKQSPKGYWESPEQPYQPKYKSTYWQIMILSQLGLDKSDERIRKACDYIFNFQLEEGGFSVFREEGAKKEYNWIEKRAKERGKKPPNPSQWISSRIREYEYSCLTGNIVAALIRLGYRDDPRVWRALNWLVKIQNRDGGWLCPYWKAHIKDTHSCFTGTITPLDAFSEVSEERRTKEMNKAIERGAEFLLMHRLYKADHHDFKVINRFWLKFSFPVIWYDVLRGLRVLTKLGYKEDERMKDALELLEKQGEDGKWILESAPSGRMQTNIEPKGKKSKWVTLNALRVLKKVMAIESFIS